MELLYLQKVFYSLMGSLSNTGRRIPYFVTYKCVQGTLELYQTCAGKKWLNSGNLRVVRKLGVPKNIIHGIARGRRLLQVGAQNY